MLRVNSTTRIYFCISSTFVLDVKYSINQSNKYSICQTYEKCHIIRITKPKKPQLPLRLFPYINILKNAFAYPANSPLPAFTPCSNFAAIYSRFIRAMWNCWIPFGHSSVQAPTFEQLPKPSASIWSTMASTLL